MENLRIIQVSYLDATKTNRVKIKELTNGMECTKTIPFDHEFDGIAEIAIEYLRRIDINIVAKSRTKDSYILLSNSWEKGFINVKGEGEAR